MLGKIFKDINQNRSLVRIGEIGDAGTDVIGHGPPARPQKSAP